MGSRRAVPALAAACLALAGAPAQAAALPTTVVVQDSRTSAPVVDIATVTLEASSYYDSEQSLSVTVPNGFRSGHRLTVFFDLDGDSEPDGHFDLRLDLKPGGKVLKRTQEFRLGGGWDGKGKKVPCTNGDDFQPVAQTVKPGQDEVPIAIDLWSCLRRPLPAGADQGAWRAAVRLAKGTQADMAPNGRRWSQPVAGWAPL